jgi:hypothetical protein
LTDPIRKSITVPLDRQAAFELYTDGIDSWWPKDTHSLTAGEGDTSRAHVRMEPRAGGKIIETRPDGSEAPWGTITTWEPGARLGIDWYVGRGPDEATQIEVVFTQTEAGTRIDLTHGGFDIHGDHAETLCANYTTGWDRVLGTCFGGACLAKAA